MSAVQDFMGIGVEIKRQGPKLRLVWHREPTAELRALVANCKAELLAELTPKEEEVSFLSRLVPSDPVALEEFEGLTSIERYNFYGCRAVCLEEGHELHQAERNAVAAVLQHRRLTRPLPDWVIAALEKERTEAPF